MFYLLNLGKGFSFAFAKEGLKMIGSTFGSDYNSKGAF